MRSTLQEEIKMGWCPRWDTVARNSEMTGRLHMLQPRVRRHMDGLNHV